jgi:hypothetical protein
LPEGAWRRLSAGEGTKGARLHDWAYLELADLDAGDFDATFPGIWTRGLLIRRNIADGDLAFFSTWCPIGTPIERLVTVEGHRWAIEDSFETAKNELGLDHNETRSWHGWHRHVSLVMLAFATMATIRRHANTPSPPKSVMKRTPRQHRHGSAGRPRKSAASPPASHGRASNRHTSSHGRSGGEHIRPKPGKHTSNQKRNCNAGDSRAATMANFVRHHSGQCTSAQSAWSKPGAGDDEGSLAFAAVGWRGFSVT